jgi:hypothetical protein
VEDADFLTPEEIVRTKLEVDHCPVLPEERMGSVARDVALPHDLAKGIDRHGRAGRPPESPEVDHRPVLPAERVV